MAVLFGAWRWRGRGSGGSGRLQRQRVRREAGVHRSSCVRWTENPWSQNFVMSMRTLRLFSRLSGEGGEGARGGCYVGASSHLSLHL